MPVCKDVSCTMSMLGHWQFLPHHCNDALISSQEKGNYGLKTENRKQENRKQKTENKKTENIMTLKLIHFVHHIAVINSKLVIFRLSSNDALISSHENKKQKTRKKNRKKKQTKNIKRNAVITQFN